MPMRLSGLSSGIDTDAVVEELMNAHKLKKQKVVSNKTKLEWKKEKWGDLNTKLYKLYNDKVSKLQLSSTYNIKKVTSSDSSKASISAGVSAADGNYKMKINNVATAEYLTGAKIGATSTNTKLADVNADLVGKQISVKVGDKDTVNFDIDSSTTISDFTSFLKEQGLNANYDTNQQRFFISSKSTGTDNAFSITSSANTSEELTALNNLKDSIGYSGLTSANKSIVDAAITKLQSATVGDDTYNEALEEISQAAYNDASSKARTSAETYIKADLYGSKYSEYESAARESLKSDYYEDDGVTLKSGKTAEAYEKAVASKADSDTVAYVNEQMATDDVKNRVDAAVYTGVETSDIEALSDKALKKYYNYPADDGSVTLSGFEAAPTDSDAVKESIRSYVDAYTNVEDRTSALTSSALGMLGMADIVATTDANGNHTVTVNGGANDSTNSSIPSGMALIGASNSEIVLNGATLTSSSTLVSVNGLDITLTDDTEGKEMSFSVANDVDSVYNMVKDFVKEYNSVMEEMKKLYNADSARDYDVLSSEQKEAMTDDEVDLWNEKIKGSLLRRDSGLYSIMNGMRNALMTTSTQNGTTYALSSFGIMTSTDYSEGGMLHIFGDVDDSVYSGKDDKLKKALTDDPENTIKALTDIFSNLKKDMSSKMSATSNSSSLTFYDDLKMDRDIKSYTEDISDWEDRLEKLEDNYYKKFTAMETAMAKLQSQQSSFGALFGG